MFDLCFSQYAQQYCRILQGKCFKFQIKAFNYRMIKRNLTCDTQSHLNEYGTMKKKSFRVVQNIENMVKYGISDLFVMLTHILRMDSPIIINLASPLSFLGVPGVFFLNFI